MELNRLTEAGLLTAGEEGKTKMYRANEQHPFFIEIKGMVSKFLGLDQLLEQVVNRLGNVEKALIVGDYAKGIDSGTIEMVLIGKNIDREYLDFLIQKTYEKVHRKVVVTIHDQESKDLTGILVYG